MSASGKRRKARHQAAIASGSHTDREWDFLVNYCGVRCVRCDAQFVCVRNAGGEYLRPVEGVDPWEWGRLSKDHVQPLVADGADSIGNLQPLCRDCNSTKGTALQDWRPAGWREAMDEALATGWAPPLAYCAGCSPDCRECNG